MRNNRLKTASLILATVVIAMGSIQNECLAQRLSGSYDLADVGTPALAGATIEGAEIGDNAGYEINSAGVVNVDGIQDLIIGATGSSPVGAFTQDRGRAYILYGSTTRISGDQKLRNGTNDTPIEGLGGFRLNSGPHNEFNPHLQLAGYTEINLLGWSVSGVGDVNGDSYYDILVGGPFHDTAYLVYGGSSLPKDMDADLLGDGSTGQSGARFARWPLPLTNQSEYVGWSVSGAGDVNNDGVDDLLVCAAQADANRGNTYLIYGQLAGSNNELMGEHLLMTIGLNSSIDNIFYPLLSSEPMLDPTIGAKFIGESGDKLGQNVAAVGDFDNDGVDDYTISTFEHGSHRGRVYLIYGATVAAASLGDINITEVGGTIPGVIFDGASIGDQAGHYVSKAGDFNHDGIDDIIIGAHRGAEAYVIYGKSTRLTGVVNLADVGTTVDGVKYTGTQHDHTGHSVSEAGDVNHDGVDDILIGAAEADTQRGKSYVLYGKRGMASGIVALSGVATGSVDGAVFEGINSDPDPGNNSVTGDWTGWSVTATDFDGDGASDILISAYFASPNGQSQSGQNYLIYGKEGIPGDANQDGVVDNLDYLAWQNGFGILNGAILEDGDFDHDGDVDGADYLILQNAWKS